MTDRRAHPASLLLIMAGWALWASAFVTMYAAQAVGCAMDVAIASHRAMMLATWILHLAALFALVIYCRKRMADTASDPLQFTCRIAFWSALTATIATAWTGSMVSFVTPCV